MSLLSAAFILSSHQLITNRRGRESLSMPYVPPLPPPHTRDTPVQRSRRSEGRESHSNHPPAHSLRSACALPVALSSLLAPPFALSLHLSVSFCHVTCPLVGVSQQLVRDTCVWRERESASPSTQSPQRDTYFVAPTCMMHAVLAI